ncbi:MAG: TetR/AcrR family transcriptional regulator [Spirochaetia bacterium]|nr:TetR/AcrR family transcriptional regulator [Spirochaetia bacterium]
MKNKSRDILFAALSLFSENGYHATSMRAIAKKADIVQSSIYNHYENKEAILIAIVRLMSDEVEKTLDIDLKLSKKERIKKFTNKIKESVNKNREFWRLIHSVRMGKDLIKIINHEALGLQEMIMKKISVLLSVEKKPVKEAEILLFWAAIDGIIAAFLLVENYPLDRVLENFSKLFYEGA